MKTFKSALALCIALLSLGLVACGSDGLSDEEYSNQIGEALAPLQDDVAFDNSQANASDPQESLDRLTDQREVIDGISSELSGIEPPEKVSEAHSQLITAFDDFGSAIGETQSQLEAEAGESQPNVQALQSSLQEFSTAGQDFLSELNDAVTQFEEAGIPEPQQFSDEG